MTTTTITGVQSGVNTTSGNTTIVAIGGVDSDTTVEAGGLEIVQSGGTAGAGGGGLLNLLNPNATFINGGTLELNSGALLGANIDFSLLSNGGVLKIDGTTTPSLLGTGIGNYLISGFAPGNTIDLANVAFDAAAVAPALVGNLLEFTEHGVAVDLQVGPASAFAGLFFHLSSDGGIGTDITINATPPCYFRGTRIATARGEVAVEDLQVGDLAITASGAQRPITWIGHRELETVKHRWPLEILPVRVRAHAFAQNAPRRDLWLSPQHAVFIGGLLVPIIHLANGATIAQERVDTVSYWHVELETHDVLLAEGLPAESFLDCGTRCGFDNGGGPIELHPTFAPKSWDDACAPLAESGPEVDALHEALRSRAFDLGYTRANDPELRVIADGIALAPVCEEGNCYRFILPATTRWAKLVSRSQRPADAGPECGDKRHLGVAATRLEIDGVAVDLATLGGGWHEVERDGDSVWRWTDGAAALPPARRLEVEIGCPTMYWREPPQARTDFALARSA